jgi:hypothetical protein
MKQQKTKKTHLRQRLTSHTKWGHGDLSLPFHTYMEQELFHTNNANTLPSFVKQKFFFESKKIRNQMVNNKPKLIATNWRSYKLYVVGFLPFRLQMEKKKMKT